MKTDHNISIRYPMRCPNCNTDLANHLKICWFCNSNLITLENFLIKKNKILVIMGIFGALSIYLSQPVTANPGNAGNFLLQMGSGMSLLIMTILSFVLLKDCYLFIKKFPDVKEYPGSSYRKWIALTAELSYLWAFLIVILLIVVSVFLFIIIFSSINSLILKIIVGFILIFILFPFIIIPADDIMRRRIFWLQLVIIFLLTFLSFLVGFLLIGTLKDITSLDFEISFGVFGISTFGWINSLWLVYSQHLYPIEQVIEPNISSQKHE